MMQSAWQATDTKGNYPSTAIQQPETIPTVERVYQALAQCDDLAYMVVALAGDICGPTTEGNGGGIAPSPVGIANQLDARAGASKLLARDAIEALRRIQGVFK